MRAGIDSAYKIVDQQHELADQAELLGDEREKSFALDQRRQQLEQNLVEAQIDEVTGLPTRKSFMESLTSSIERARRDGKTLAVVFGDLNLLKFHNDYTEDKFDAGNRYLQGVARAWEGLLRPSDRLGRIGGDEIAALLPGIDAPEDTEELEKAIAQRTEEGVNTALEANENIDHTWPAHLSVGVAILRSGETAEAFLNRAGVKTKAAQVAYKQTLSPGVVAKMRAAGDDRFRGPTEPPQQAVA
jgi:diguanylate cyclase (GGDEF)-like protein